MIDTLVYISNYIHAHPLALASVMWMFFALVSTLPKPLSTERWYQWIYNFLNAVAANLDKTGERYASTISSSTNSDGNSRTPTK